MPGRGLISVDKSRPVLTNSGHKKLMLGPRSGDRPETRIVAYCCPDATLLPVYNSMGWAGSGIITRRSGIDGCLL
jgi:hypothetical protein